MAFSRTALLSLLVLAAGLPLMAGDVPAPRDVTIALPNGAKLRATYYAAAGPGPAVMLFHMCNTTRESWKPIGPRLAAAGFHALALDYRGFGESDGERFQAMPPQAAQKMVVEQWPGDIDAAYAFLLSQLGVDKSRVGAAGGSCGVNQSVLFARRHPEIRSLVLLAGNTTLDGLRFLQQSAWLPLFAAAADDDQFGAGIPEQMRWLLALSGNPRNRFSHFKDGKHGTEIFGPHPELMEQIVEWYRVTLVKKVADPEVAVAASKTPARELYGLAIDPATVPRAIEFFHHARKREPNRMLIPETVLNLLGYQYLQAGQRKEAIEIFKLNTIAYPASANTFDSLGDAYLAAGQNDLALEASQKAIDLLAADKSPDDFKKGVRASAEEKIAKLKGKGSK